MAKHKHYDLIMAWANGAEIQREYIFGKMVNSRYTPEWQDDPNPKWIESVNYRVKTVPHVHQELIDAHAKGAVIQYWDNWYRDWRDVAHNTPNWGVKEKYRIKPHLHQAMIDAYKAGKTIQVKSKAAFSWVTLNPTAHIKLEDNFHEDMEYRIHPHQEFIDAYDAGEFIEYRCGGQKWLDLGFKTDTGKQVIWYTAYEYRIRPAKIVIDKVVHYHDGNMVFMDNLLLTNVRFTVDPDTKKLLSVEKIW